MKGLLACLVLAFSAVALSGCYYDPGYGYVRGSGYSGDAYYGSGSTYYAAPGYYDGYSGYYPGYYNGYDGCCYAPGVNIGIGAGWYGGSRYRDYRGYRGHGDYRRGNYSGSRGHGQPGHYRSGRAAVSNGHGSYRGGRSTDSHHDHHH